MKTVDIRHIWTKETKTLPVETIYENRVTLRWELSGIYELFLKTNQMRAVSVSARRKNPFCLWEAVDIASVREAVFKHFHPNIDKVEESYRKHHESRNHIGKTCRPITPWTLHKSKIKKT